MACVVMGAGWLACGIGVAAAQTAPGNSFATPGNYSVSVPPGVSSVSISAVGAAGGSCGWAGGLGAALSGTFAVTPGEQLDITVGGPGLTCGGNYDTTGGVGGGGTGGTFAASGGGASGVSFGASQLIVAGGGGGSGLNGNGGNAGADGVSYNTFDATPGGAGTSTAGGAAGIDGTAMGGNGQAGGFGVGGSGGGLSPALMDAGGGGGGGGYYGGGGGGASINVGAGGGGGSSFLAADATGTSGPTPTGGSPSVTLTFATPTAALSTGALVLGSQTQGSVGPEQTVTVTDTGSVPLIVSGVQTGGVDPGDYLIADRCQQPVSPGGSCQVGVRFSPQAQGASSATLAILTNASNALAVVMLSGTGTAPTAPSVGPQGPAGPQGLRGPQGPPGPAGTIVCQNTTLAQALCSLEFAPGTFIAHGPAKAANFRIEHSGRTIATGTLPVKPGTATREKIGKLRRGRYTLIISTGHGHHTKVLLKETFNVS